MEGESELHESQKRVAPPSTVSLDSTYDHEDEAAAEKHPLHKRHSWTPLVVLAGLILVAVALVLALDRDDPSHQGIVVDEGDPFVSRPSALMSGRSLTGPQHQLVAWLKQMENASQLLVEGGSSNSSVSGLLFPRNGSGTCTWLPFDAVVTIESGVALPTRKSIVVHDGRGYKWAATSLGYGDSIVTNGCLTSNRTASLNELDEVVYTANWTSDDPNDDSEVNVVFGGRNYTVSKEEGDYNYDSSETEDVPRCWSVESGEEDFGLRVCIPALWQELPREDDFTELFNATSGCPQLAPNPTKMKAVVPLPLRKWYASYKSL